jgi:hypothetical protein
MPEFIQWISTILLVITSFGVLVDLEWKINSALMALQYFATFFLLMVFWPINMSGSFLIAGWVSVLIIVMTDQNIKRTDRPEINTFSLEKLFRLFTGGLVLLIIVTSYSNISNWFPSATPPLLISSLNLIFIGFLMIGMSQKIDRVIFGLLTIMTGFEIAFTQVDNSVLMVALLCLILMSISLVGSFLMNNAEGK